MYAFFFHLILPQPFILNVLRVCRERKKTNQKKKSFSVVCTAQKKNWEVLNRNSFAAYKVNLQGT